MKVCYLILLVFVPGGGDLAGVVVCRVWRLGAAGQTLEPSVQNGLLRVCMLDSY